MIIPIDIYDFIQYSKNNPVLDVRSENEFTQGCFPGALNLPILNNENRKKVGIVYKNEGKSNAVLLGYKLAGSDFPMMIQYALDKFPQRKLLVYCYRGGLRSKIMCDVLSSAGFNIYKLKGGYKKYRNWVLETLKLEKNIYILGGYTGSDKTGMLSKLPGKFIDLEGLAVHRGSAFGGIGLGPQPTTENFENQLAMQWSEVSTKDPLWLEDESKMIGKVAIPPNIYKQIREAPVFKPIIPIADRITHILNTYGRMPVEELEEATRRCERRMGSEKNNKAIQYLRNKELEKWLTLLLEYYDASYLYGNQLRHAYSVFSFTPGSFNQYLNQYFPKKPEIVYISLGGNLGDVPNTFQKAISILKHSDVIVSEISSLYKTEAWGVKEQPAYFNQVLKLLVFETPHQFLSKILSIENQFGRVRNGKYLPRTIDIDILIFGNRIIQSESLKIPHPLIQKRKFVLVPLTELDKNLTLPDTEFKVCTLLKKCDDPLQVEKVESER